ncbi:sacsin N-terminal ATP-binding-like domain-containing protein [Agaribacterium sp. ZY112]|uniref:sacsin N-terminal ATP-binding-like domain-containing protein n=1 Tax=Agaribacterium sp. ZY112 TaxID=3233574 RepID=UPI00352391C8
MSIKNVVEKLFYDNTNYTTPDQATNQASSLEALSTDLYTDSKRFIYELLQNADDSPEQGSTVKVWIKRIGETLIVAHSGKAFNERDVRGLCNVNNGTKKGDASKTGYKGIGFKSVFGQSKEVTVYTNDEYFRFDSFFPFTWQWGEKKEDWERNNNREFIPPWQIIPIYTEHGDVLTPIHQYLQSINAKVATIIKLDDTRGTFQAVQELSENVDMFLFLKNIDEINFEVNGLYKIEINRSENSGVKLITNGEVVARWLVNTIVLDVPPELTSDLEYERNIPEKLLTANNIELTLAAKIGEDGVAELEASEKLIYSYLPTDETKYQFPVLVNTSFLTNANREHLHVDSKWNQWLFKNIAIEIFKWISILVVGEEKFQAYRLIPREVIADELGRHFNEGVNDAINTVEFVLTKNDGLVKVSDTIVDFTYLSEKQFVGEKSIKKALSDLDGARVIHSKYFMINHGFGGRIKSLGAESFEWKDLPKLLKSKSFSCLHSINKNIELIKHLKSLSLNDSIGGVSDEILRGLPFIFDHRNRLNKPTEIYFPTADDNNWDDPGGELAFLHIDIQKWISSVPDMRAWIEQLGVVEKTDVSFITKTIIPNSEIYINRKNAIQAIRDLFNLYKKDELNSNILAQLSDLKLLTNNGSLVAAKKCILSSSYSPRLEIESVLGEDVFVSKMYMDNSRDKDEWKRFFKFLKVSDGISLVTHEKKSCKTVLVANGFREGYFNEDDKKFKPFLSTFTGDEYKNLIVLRFIHQTINNHPLSKQYWHDVINNHSSSELSSPATTFWGNSRKLGRTTGDLVENYTQWVIKSLCVIPVATKECKRSSEVLLNTDEIKDLAGEYLPVFDGVELSDDWRSFFKFRSKLELSDYLELLSEISSDLSVNEKVKESNINRVQLIYRQLLDLSGNWGEMDLEVISEWSCSGLLLNTKNQFSKCTSTKYFIDGNDAVFQGYYEFLNIGAENKQHSNIVVFLNAFKITILRQSDFRLESYKSEDGKELIARLESSLPFFKAWVENENDDPDTLTSLKLLDDRFSLLGIYEAEAIQITYKDLGFSKSVNVHLDGSKLFVTKPWESNKVFLQLPSVLCRYFGLIGHDKKLTFLLRSETCEIKECFEQESIAFPVDVTLRDDKIINEFYSTKIQSSDKVVKTFDEVKTAISNGTSPDFFHISTSDYQKLVFVEGLISRAVSRVIEFLDKLHEYDCANHYEIAPSIIGGVTKNGRDITVVARPSDNDAVLLYYTSEFDVLEYVDSEFWCVDGTNVPQRVTIGHLLRMTKINRIPIANFKFEDQEFEEFVKKKKTVDFEFDPVPSSPYKIAQTISSFANTEGGELVYGITKNGTENQLLGLSTDFRMDEITREAMKMISPLPAITYNWVDLGGKRIFIIKVKKSNEELLIRGQKYIRDGCQTRVEGDDFSCAIESLAVSGYEKTVAIIIGIENYKPRGSGQVQSVKYAEEDALLFKEILLKQFEVDENDIYMYINENALKSDLEYGLSGLFHSLSENDRLVFYYVGHGFHNGTTNYLSTYDTHINNVAETAVSLRKILLDPLLNSKCKSGLVFIDACAKSFKDDGERALISDLDGDDFQLFKSDHPHFATFLSCQPGQSSYSCDELRHGIWTYFLHEALSGRETEVIKSSKYITDRKLSDYLTKCVSFYAKDRHDFEQNPKAILDSTCENVLVEL